MDHGFRSNPVGCLVRNPRYMLMGILIGSILLGLASDSLALWDNGNFEIVNQQADYSSSYDFCSDAGGGQSFLAVCLTGDLNRIVVRKYSRTGRALWGEDGVMVPWNIQAEAVSEPVRVASDYHGGVYVTFVEQIAGHSYAAAAHFDSQGQLLWRRLVGDLQQDGIYFYNYATVQVVADDSDPAGCFVAWSREDPANYDYFTIDAAYLDAATGNPHWAASDLIQYSMRPNRLGGPPVGFDAASDGLGGFLVSTDNNIQRLDHLGYLLYGNPAPAGLWAGGDFDRAKEIVVPDGGGGAYVVVPYEILVEPYYGYTYVYVQHVDADGDRGWSEEECLQLFENGPFEVSACSDGAGGLYYAAGWDSLSVQRLDSAGNKLWGPDGLVLADFADPVGGSITQEYALAPDGFGGFFLVYRDPDLSPGAMSAIQVNNSGGVVWQRRGIYQEEDDSHYAYDMQVATDGRGGISFAFQSFSAVCLGSVDKAGNCPPVPTISYLDTPWTEQGPGQPLLLHGQYLDPENDYFANSSGREYGLSAVSATEEDITLYGEVDLSGAMSGPFGVSIWQAGGEVGGLVDCLGVSPAPDCFLMYGTWSYENLTDQVTYGRRSGAITAEGIGLQAFLMSSTTGGDSRLQMVRNDSGDLVVETVLTTGDAISDVVLTAPLDSDRHLAYVRDDGLLQYLVYQHNGAVYELPQPVLQLGKPALAVNDNGQALIVFQGWDSWSNCFVLKSVEVGSAGFGTVVDLNAGCNSVGPDLVAIGTNFVVTYTRDLWLPGAREVCFQEYGGNGWTSPESLNFAWNISCPSVAWDGDDDLLFSYVLDNYTGEQVLFTNFLHLGTLEAAKRIKAAPLIAEALVLGAGQDLFHLVTAAEYASGYGLSVEIHNCDDRAVYPPAYLGQSQMPFLPTLAGNRGGRLAVTWNQENGPSISYNFLQYQCGGAISATDDMPVRTAALEAYPNPFNPSTTFAFALGRAQDVTLDVYDLKGARVRRLHRGPLAVGRHEFTWNGRDESGRQAASGVYFARLTGRGVDQGVKIVLIK